MGRKNYFVALLCNLLIMEQTCYRVLNLYISVDIYGGGYSGFASVGFQQQEIS